MSPLLIEIYQMIALTQLVYIIVLINFLHVPYMEYILIPIFIIRDGSDIINDYQKIRC